MLSVQCALRVLHITSHGFENDPCSTDECKEGPWDGAERVEKATLGDSADQLNGHGSDDRLYKGQVPA